MQNDNDNTPEISSYRQEPGGIPPRRRQKSIWPWLLALVVFLIAAIAGAMFATDSLLDKKKPTKKFAAKPQKEEERMLTAHDKAIIMLMGVDVREDDVGRSDTLMIAAIDPKLNKVSLLSIPRDTRVRIGNRGYDKINAAYAYGGEQLTQRTVENFLGVNIDHYVIVNVQSFVKIIDAIGGVDINVEKRMYYEDPWDDNGGLYIDLQPGMQHMDGKTAVTYVRFRDEEGDIGRVKRQQMFMQACMDKVTSPSMVLRLPAVAKEIFSSLQTDLTLRQIVEFAGSMYEARNKGITADMVPGYPLYIDEISYWIPDIGKTRYAVANTLDVEVSSTMRANFEREAREYEASIPDSATDVPARENSIGYTNQYEPPRRSAPHYSIPQPSVTREETVEIREEPIPTPEPAALPEPAVVPTAPPAESASPNASRAEPTEPVAPTEESAAPTEKSAAPSPSGQNNKEL